MTAPLKTPSVNLLKFAYYATVIGLIQDGDESAYRQEVEQLAVWCRHNNLELNTLKTVEMIVDFRRNPAALPPLTIMNNTVAAVESFRFLGATISQFSLNSICAIRSVISLEMKCPQLSKPEVTHMDSIVEKAQQRLYFLRQLKS